MSAARLLSGWKQVDALFLKEEVGFERILQLCLRVEKLLDHFVSPKTLYLMSAQSQKFKIKEIKP